MKLNCVLPAEFRKSPADIRSLITASALALLSSKRILKRSWILEKACCLSLSGQGGDKLLMISAPYADTDLGNRRLSLSLSPEVKRESADFKKPSCSSQGDDGFLMRSYQVTVRMFAMEARLSMQTSCSESIKQYFRARKRGKSGKQSSTAGRKGIK